MALTGKFTWRGAELPAAYLKRMAFDSDSVVLRARIAIIANKGLRDAERAAVAALAAADAARKGKVDALHALKIEDMEDGEEVEQLRAELAEKLAGKDALEVTGVAAEEALSVAEAAWQEAEVAVTNVPEVDSEAAIAAKNAADQLKAAFKVARANRDAAVQAIEALATSVTRSNRLIADAREQQFKGLVDAAKVECTQAEQSTREAAAAVQEAHIAALPISDFVYEIAYVPGEPLESQIYGALKQQFPDLEPV